MSKKDEQFLVGDIVYHRVNDEDRIPGIVIKAGLVEIDWGPEHGTSVHDPATIVDKFKQRFDQ
jgi:hypothetical protein